MTSNTEGIQRYMAERLSLNLLLHAVDERDALRAENAMLRQDLISLAKGYEDRIGELHAALDALVDDERCSLDHEGYCQIHSLSRPCDVATAREVLGRRSAA